MVIMNLKKIFAATIVFTMFILCLSPQSSKAETPISKDDQSKILETFSDKNDPLVKLLDEIPMKIAEKGPADAVKWLNKNNTELNGKFVAQDEFVKFIPAQEKSSSVKAMGISGACVWAVTKVIGLNFIPWAKILKVKSVAKSFGGIAQLTKLVYKSYTHQRNLGLSQTKAIKKAVRLVVGGKGFEDTKIEAVLQFFELDDVVKDCF